VYVLLFHPRPLSEWLVNRATNRQIKQWEYFQYGAHSRIATPPQAGSNPPKSTGLLCYGASASQEMEEEEHYTHDEGDVNESTGDVKCEKPKQPKNDQDRCDYPKHV
jgi:hypothetical protein